MTLNFDDDEIKSEEQLAVAIDNGARVNDLQVDGAITWSDGSTTSSDPDGGGGGGGNGDVANLSISNWDVIDVGHHGFPGDRSGGDLAQFVADNTSAGSKTVFILPDGTYDWQRSVQFDGDGGGTYDEDRPDSIAIIGKQEATLRVDIGSSVNYRDRLCFEFGDSGLGIENVVLKNLHFDVGDALDERDAGIMRAYIESHGVFENITLTRRKRIADDGGSNGDRHTFKLDTINEDGVSIVRNVRFPNGEVFQSEYDSVGHSIPFASEDFHVGTNHWVDCYVEGFTDNGFYLRDGPGSNYVRGCTAKDCSAGMFRLGRNDHAENITAIMTSALDYSGTPIWVHELRDSVPDPDEDNQDQYVAGDEDASPVVVDGFEIICEDAPSAIDLIRVSSNPGQVEFTNGYIRNRSDSYIVDFTHYTGSVKFSNITVDDHATGNTRLAAINVDGPNVTFDNLTYRGFPPSGEAGRSVFWANNDAERFTVRDSDIQATTSPLFEVESSAEVTMSDCKNENSDGSANVARLNSTPAEYVTMKYNVFSGYSGLNASTSNMNHYFIVNNVGLTDQTSS